MKCANLKKFSFLAILWFHYFFQVNVGEPTDSNKVKVFGPGVEPGVKARVPTHFNIDSRGAGAGDLFYCFLLLDYIFDFCKQTKIEK